MYLFPKHAIIAIWNNSIQNGRIAKKVHSCSYLAYYHHLAVSDIEILLTILI